MAVLQATVPPPDGKAILDTNTDVTIDHLAFTGAKVADGNGAGIRYAAGNLTVTNSLFYDNQDGILGSPPVADTGSVTISNSEFDHNGAGDGSTHNLYIGNVASLTIDDSYFHDAVVGHEIKSRAFQTTITNTRVFDGPTGTASYSIDLPNGGVAVIANDIIQQGPDSQNPAIIAYGEEGSLHPGGSLAVTGTTILNDLSSGSASAVYNTTTTVATLAGDSFYGLAAGQVLRGPGTISNATYLSSEPALDTSAPGTAAPTVPAAPPAVTPAPSADTLVVSLSEDAWQGDALASISIDGTPLTHSQAVTASHAAGASQSFTFNGSFGAGPHSVAVSFLNDAYGGTGQDRNLYVTGITYDGTAQPGDQAALYSGGTHTFAVPAAPATVPAAPPTVPAAPPTVPAAPVTVPAAPSADTLVVSLSEDAWQGDALASISIDGTPLAQSQAVTASHTTGASQSFTFNGSFGAGPHTVAVSFLNDAYGGTGQDRNLYVTGIAYDGTAQPGDQAALYSGGTHTFAVPAAPTAVPPTAVPPTALPPTALPPAAVPPAPPAASDLVLHLSEDMFNGDAQFAVSVDGTSEGAPQTVSAQHGLGQSAAFAFAAAATPGVHDVAISFLNDAYGGQGQDRNLYVNGASLGSAVYAGPTMPLWSNGTVHLQLTLPPL